MMFARAGSCHPFLLFASVLLLGAATLPTAAAPPSGLSVEERRRFADAQLMFCFQGKGSCLPYDAGVLHEAYSRLPALRENRVIIAGNSSGSIAAAYFACFGFSDATVKHAVTRLTEGNRDAVRNMENPHSKLSKSIRGKPTEISHENLREYIAFALGVERWQDAKSLDEIVARSTAKPRYPIIIVSCNKEVLEDADASDGRASSRYKEFDLNTLTASWRPEVHEFYRAHPERFASDHPDLVLSDDRRIGRGVTYFVDRTMYALLSQIPPEERQADLRLIETAADVALAIKASVSEPTYFAPVPELQPDRLLVDSRQGDLGNVRKRTYYGGYIVAVPSQDVRRMLPGVRVFGTGFRHFALLSRSTVRDWLLADVELVAQRTEWWADLETYPDAEMESHMDFRDLTAQQEFEFGRRRAVECFAGHAGLPKFVARPKFDYPAAAAIMPAYAADDMFEKPEAPAIAQKSGKSGDVPARQPLKSNRGLGPLLTEPRHVP
ncbi:MAG: hypothetical protein C0483_09945 [Pirellula sp.]|nr:hypothetical protein [Pirellula sp.]